MTFCKHITIFLMAWLSLLAGHSIAQDRDNEFRQLSTKEGLRLRAVRAIDQDENGYVWLGAVNKLIKYDGHTFQEFGDPIIEHRSIRQVASDGFDNKWILLTDSVHEKEIVVFDEKVERFFTFSEKFDIDQFPEIAFPESIRINHSGDPIILTSSGGAFLITQESLSKIFQSPGYKPIADLIILDSVRMFIHSNNQLFLYASQKSPRLLGEIHGPSKLFAFQDTLWAMPEITGKTSIPYIPLVDDSYPIKSKEVAIPPEIFKADDIHRYEWDGTNQMLWALSEKHILAWNWNTGVLEDFSRLFDDFPLTKHVYMGFADLNGQFWLGTGDGIFIHHPEKPLFESFFTRKQTNKQISIRGIALLDSKIYVNSYLGTLSMEVESKKFDVFVPRSKEHHLALKADDSGMLWSGHSSFLTQYIRESTDRTFEFEGEGIRGSHNWDIWEVYFDSKGKTWIGTENGLGHLNHDFGKLAFYQSPVLGKEPSNSRVYSIKETDSNYWISSSKGLLYFDPVSGFESPHKKDSLLSKFKNIPISHFLIDEQRVFWLATDGNGLIRWDRDNGSYDIFDQTTGLLNNHIHAVYEDEEQGLWLPSNNGIMRFDKESHGVHHFTTKNGLPHNEFNRIAHHQDKLGNLYFGGVMGMVRFNPNTYLENIKQHQGKLKVQQLRLLNGSTGKLTAYPEEWALGQPIRVEPHYAGFELEVHLMDFMQNHSYAYRIEELQEEWTYQNSPKLLIAGLDPGKYTLMVRAHNRYGQWPDQIKVPLHIIKPVYLSWWFRASVVLFTFFFGLLLYKFRVNQIKRTNVRLEREVRERTLKIEQDKLLLAKQAEKLERQEKQKTLFYSNISHDLRTPLTMIEGPLEMIINKTGDREIRQLAQWGLQNSRLTLKLIKQLVDLGRQEHVENIATWELVDMVAFVEGMTLSFENMARHQDIILSFSSVIDTLSMECDIDKLEKIIYNLLSNAFKYTPPGGSIKVGIRLRNGICSILVSDTGIGISKRDQPRIFDRYFQVGSKKNGVGIGLSIVHDLVTTLGGAVSLESELGSGTVFQVDLPYKPIPTNGNDAINLIPRELPNTVQFFQHTANDTDEYDDGDPRKIILVIDDVAVIRHYIQYSLSKSNHYRILDASNGVEGLEMARKHVPDLVICDVKMPVMDGYEFCTLLKSDIGISHIPVILLTALAEIEQKIEGLESGADDYLYKPFNSKELFLKVKNILAHQENVAAFYRDLNINSRTNEATTEINPKEQHFLKDVVSKIQLHLGDGFFGVSELSGQMCMSRKNLHRKLKALTGQSPSTFIRVARLKVSLELLQSGKYNVSEVSFLVGFNSPTYFSKCFQEYYGFSPKNISVNG